MFSWRARTRYEGPFLDKQWVGAGLEQRINLCQIAQGNPRRIKQPHEGWRKLWRRQWMVE